MIRQDIRGWMDQIDLDKLRIKLQNRKVFIWGAFLQGGYVKEFLEKNEIDIEGYVDSFNQGEYCGTKVYPFEEVSKVENRYIFVAVNGIREQIMNLLISSGMEDDQDYFYISHEYTVQTRYYYKDIYGNEIISKSNLSNVSIQVNGYNSKVVIGKNVLVKGELLIVLGSSNKIVIEDGCQFSYTNQIITEYKSNVKVGFRCIVNSLQMHSYSQIYIGNKVNLGSNNFIIANTNSPIEIGDRCLFASNIQVRSGNGHSIFDLIEQNEISNIKNKCVFIGKHVWIGDSSKIMQGSYIGDESVVGTSTLTTKKYNQHVLIVGSPGKVLRESIVWDDEEIDWKDFCERKDLMQNE